MLSVTKPLLTIWNILQLAHCSHGVESIWFLLLAYWILTSFWWIQFNCFLWNGIEYENFLLLLLHMSQFHMFWVLFLNLRDTDLHYNFFFFFFLACNQLMLKMKSVSVIVIMQSLLIKCKGTTQHGEEFSFIQAWILFRSIQTNMSNRYIFPGILIAWKKKKKYFD